MIDLIISKSLQHRALVLIVTLMVAVAGTWAMLTTPVDAIPDLSDVQVIIYSEHAGQSPQVIEDQVTYPLTTAFLSVPGAVNVRGYSFFGFSLVYVIFEDGTDQYWARSRVLEYLNFAKDRLPKNVAPRLGPDATGVGWVYMYSLSDFLPRTRVLNANLKDGKLPAPKNSDFYSDEQLIELFIDKDLKTEAEQKGFAQASLKYIFDAFDKDHDGHISKAELQAAADFKGVDLAQLRSLQDWYLRYDLMSVKGVSEVASLGGFVKQYQVEVDPEKLRAFGVSLSTVKKAIQRSNEDVGGKLLEMGETEYMVRGKGYITSVEDLEAIPISVDMKSHVPVLLKQVADIHLGPENRRGIAEMNGEGEVVSGIVVMRSGENALSVIGSVENRLAELKKGLPAGVEIHTSYDRSHLIKSAVKTLREKILEEMLIVALVCFLFLLHFRSSFVAIFTLPIGILMSFLIMKWLGINANIMSLGGIALAIGVMVDASIVMVENLHKHREREPDKGQLDLVLASAKEVGSALFFSLLIVTISFLPVFTLGQQEGKLFSPLAYTKTFAMGSSAILAITLIPVLMFFLVRGKIRHEDRNPISKFLMRMHLPFIKLVLRFPKWTVGIAFAVLVTSLVPFFMMGSEFMPPLNEGDLLYMPTTPPGISITKAKELLQQTNKLIKGHPQVKHVLGKIGRAETATDPAPLSMIETTILLTPKNEWPSGKSIEDVISELNQRVQIPGLTNAWTMPIKTRIDMLATGIKTPVGIKLMGDNLEKLGEIAVKIEAELRPMPGVSSVYAERVLGGNFIDIDVRREDAARYGLTTGDVQDVIASAIGGMNVTWTVEGLERYPINLRFPRDLRNDIDKLKHVAVPTKMGHAIPLASVADIKITKGAPVIKSENSRQTAWIYVDLSTTDIGGFVENARRVISENIPIPPGISIAWSGQYEYMARAKQRLQLVIPLTLMIILLLLYLHFKNFSEALLVMGTLPFALVGGIWLCFLSGFNMSVAVAVGFIALAGLAAETSVVMLVYLDQAFKDFMKSGKQLTTEALKQIVIQGTVERLRPKIMTVATTILALMPIMFGSETGARVMKRIAAPMVGGLLSSALLTLIILPAIYYLWKKHAYIDRVA